ncbi:hypothetical protein BJ165DRAFT_10600 [Panaeolus papilionaceus]|nr:hypothetical protein BJ165DRAFT_10600 [Panaeolus papilionaceus]
MWQASYRNHPNIPGLPSDLSDYAWWTTFIFGPDTCQQCGCAGAIPNFCFRWRMCDSCMLERCALIDHLTLPSRFLRRCSVLHFEQLFVIILPVSKQSSAFSWFSPQVYSKREFKSRVNEIIRRLERLKDESGIPLFLDVHIEQTKLKLHRMRDIHTAEMWVQGVWNSVEAVYQADVNKSVERWKAHLSKKYPDPVIQDLTATIRSLVERESLRFSTKVAKKYFAELQIEITYLMRPYENLRRERQRQRLQRLYGKVINECAFSFVDAGIGGLNPGWQHFATTLRQEETTNLEALLESESKRDTFSPDMRSRIHAFVGEWILAEKRKLVDALAETPCLDNCTLSGGKEDAIYLACATFRCVGGPHPPNTRTNTFFGWRQAHEHFRCERQDDDFRAVDLPRYEFNEPVYKAVVFLLRSLGLDPNVTRCSDIDRLDPIFLCLSCPEVHGKTRSNGRLPMAWRDSVLHLFDHWNAHYRTDHSEEVHLAIMSESMKQIFRKHSQPCKPQHHPQMSCWRCCHCPARHHSRKDVLSHLKLDHSVTSAMPHEDYFVLPTNLCKYDIPSNAFRVTIGRNLSCCQCPDSRQSKLWYFRDLRKHLKDFLACLDTELLRRFKEKTIFLFSHMQG